MCGSYAYEKREAGKRERVIEEVHAREMRDEKEGFGRVMC